MFQINYGMNSLISLEIHGLGRMYVLYFGQSATLSLSSVFIDGNLSAKLVSYCLLSNFV